VAKLIIKSPAQQFKCWLDAYGGLFRCFFKEAFNMQSIIDKAREFWSCR